MEKTYLVSGGAGRQGALAAGVFNGIAGVRVGPACRSGEGFDLTVPDSQRAAVEKRAADHGYKMRLRLDSLPVMYM